MMPTELVVDVYASHAITPITRASKTVSEAMTMFVSMIVAPLFAATVNVIRNFTYMQCQ